MRLFKDFYKRITRPVIPDFHDIHYYAFQHHLEHVGISLLSTLILVLVGINPLISSFLVISGFLYAKNKQGNIPIHKKSALELKDAFTDLNQYMITFVLSFYLVGLHKQAFCMLFIILVIYIVFNKWTKP